MKAIDARFMSTPLLLGQVVAVLALAGEFTGTARVAVLALALFDAILVCVGLTVRSRAVRWWNANRIGTRYERW